MRLSDDSAGQAQVHGSSSTAFGKSLKEREMPVCHTSHARCQATHNPPYKIPLRQMLKGEWMPPFRLRACLPIMGPWR